MALLGPLLSPSLFPVHILCLGQPERHVDWRPFISLQVEKYHLLIWQ